MAPAARSLKRRSRGLSAVAAGADPRPVAVAPAVVTPYCARPRAWSLLAAARGVLLGLNLVHLPGGLHVGVLDRLLVAGDRLLEGGLDQGVGRRVVAVQLPGLGEPLLGAHGEGLEVLAL